jgi:hypothetical protein
MPNEIPDILAERRKTHGDYGDHARVTQALKRVMEGEKGWVRLDDCQREALAIIAHKIGRILSGNPNFDDHWVDIGGYAKLVADRIKEQDRISQSWTDAAVAKMHGHKPMIPPTAPAPAAEGLRDWRRLNSLSTSGLRAQLIDLGRSPPSPVGDALARDIRAELERRERRPGSADAGAHHARHSIEEPE